MKRSSKSLNKFLKLSGDFVLAKDEEGNFYLCSKYFDLSILIKKGGYIPKSGLLMAEYLKNFSIKDFSVLDIGTGETGILAQCMLSLGAKNVVAIDLDVTAISHAITSSTKAQKIIWEVGDTFPLVHKGPFNLIISNPPQMPTCHEEIFHDTAGFDGRKVIYRILEGTPEFLKGNGKLIVLCFDFLGVDHSYGPQKSLFQIAKTYGLNGKIISKYPRQIRKGGETEKNLEWIEKIYPKYKFKSVKSKQKLYHIYLAEFSFEK